MAKHYELKRACREALSILANALENDTLIKDNTFIANATIDMAVRKVRARLVKSSNHQILTRSKKDEGI